MANTNKIKGSLSALIGKRSKVSIRNKLLLYRAIIRPTMSYASKHFATSSYRSSPHRRVHQPPGPSWCSPSQREGRAVHAEDDVKTLPDPTTPRSCTPAENFLEFPKCLTAGVVESVEVESVERSFMFLSVGVSLCKRHVSE